MQFGKEKIAGEVENNLLTGKNTGDF